MLTTHEAEVLQHLVHVVGLHTTVTEFDKAMKRLKQFGYVVETRKEYIVTNNGRRALRAHANN